MPLERGLGVLLLSVSFALVESVVVVYLRALYYPEGFAFPMKLIPEEMIRIEIMREAATMLLLLSVAWLAGRSLSQRLAWFLIAFGVWDIFYYLWLKLFLDWPASVLTWDLLFLIPIPWVAPVLSPVLVALTWIVYGAMILYREHHGHLVRLKYGEWGLMLLGAFMIFITYIRDYAGIICRCCECRMTDLLDSTEFITASAAYEPGSYGWGLFWLGWLLMAGGMVWSLRRA